MELSITYRGARGARMLVPATLRKGNTPGTWSVWADNPADAPFTWCGNRRVARALIGGLTTEKAAKLYPEHAETLLSQPDSSD
jgi:hypothetical protein